MKPSFHLYQIEEQPLRLKGDLSPTDLGVGDLDELIHVQEPLVYDLVAEKVADAILVQGQVRVVLACECARCLRSFPLVLDWPKWTAHLPLTGEESVKPVAGEVDLTPFLREDTLLRFPQQPLCEPGCVGLAQQKSLAVNRTPNLDEDSGSVWSALNQLKLK